MNEGESVAAGDRGACFTPYNRSDNAFLCLKAAHLHLYIRTSDNLSCFGGYGDGKVATGDRDAGTKSVMSDELPDYTLTSGDSQ